jgi:hypothetical protein
MLNSTASQNKFMALTLVAPALHINATFSTVHGCQSRIIYNTNPPLPNSIMAASSSALNTYELLENILLHVPLRQQQVAQRVNKNFHAVI